MPIKSGYLDMEEYQESTIMVKVIIMTKALSIARPRLLFAPTRIAF